MRPDEELRSLDDVVAVSVKANGDLEVVVRHVGLSKNAAQQWAASLGHECYVQGRFAGCDLVEVYVGGR